MALDDDSVKELLARLDERTERLDRDIRTMINGQDSRNQLMEAKIENYTKDLTHRMKSTELMVGRNSDRVQEALATAQRHDRLFEWALRIVLSTIILGLMGLVVVGPV